MVTTRRQASTGKLPSAPVKPANESDSEDTDSSSDIPATVSTIRKTGPSYGPTLRPTKTRPEISPLKRKRESLNHTPPTKKRQKRAGADYETTTQSALESINAFRPDIRASPRIMIPLPTSTQLLANMQENRQLPVRGENVGLGTRDRTPMSMDHEPPLSRILFTQHSLAGLRGKENKETVSNLEVADSGQTIVAREAPGRDIYTIQESPQVSNPVGDYPGSDIESPTRRHGDHSGPYSTEKAVDNQNQIDPIDEMDGADDEEDRPEREQETQYHTARDQGSPDLGSDQLVEDIYEMPGELEPSGRPLATGNLQGMTHSAKQKVDVTGVTRVPKIPHFLSGSTGSVHSSSMPVHEYSAQTNSQSPPSMPTQPIIVHKVPNGLPRMPPLVDSSQVPPPGAQQMLSSPHGSDVNMADRESEDDVEDAHLGRNLPARQETIQLFADPDDLEDLRGPADAEEGVDDILDDPTLDEEELESAPTRKTAVRATHTHRPRVNGTFGTNGAHQESDPFGDADENDHDQPHGSSHRQITQALTTGGAAGRGRVSAGPKDSLLFQAPESVVAQHTASLPSGPVQKMHNLMGKPGWTELGKGWSRDLLEDSNPFGDVNDEVQAQEQTPTLTKLGGLLFKSLVLLKKKFTKAPSAPQFQAQNQWLLQQQQSLGVCISEIDKLVKRICEDRLAVLGDSERPTSNDLELRKALARDLVLCLVPMLVHTLWHAFCLGGFDIDAVTGVKGLPIGEGEFTTTTLQYVGRLAGWLVRLDRVLIFELEQRPFYQGLVDGLSEENKVKYPALCRKRREQLSKLLRSFKVDVDAALQDMDKKANEERRRAERIQMEDSIKAAKEQAIRAEGERVRKQNEAFSGSTQQIRADSMREKEQVKARYHALAQSFQTVREPPRATQNSATAQEYGYDERAGREISQLYKALHKGSRPWEKTGPPAAATSSHVRSSNENGGWGRYFSQDDGGSNGRQEEEDEDCSSVTEARDPPEAEDDDEADPFTRETPPSRRQPNQPHQQQPPIRPNHHQRPAHQEHANKPTHTPWSNKDKHELLKAIRREKPGQRLVDRVGYEAIAEVLEKPLAEVMVEAALLRKAARHEARAQRKPIERWAMEK